MKQLVPPPVIAALLAGCMWLADTALRSLRVPFTMPLPVTILLLTTGLILAGAAAVEFLRHRTTINPMAPARATRLITNGVYRLSRNPIYLADLLLLAAFAIWLTNAASIIFLATFVWSMNRWQIPAEEHALQKLFGPQYADYCSQVRRWI